MNLEGSFYCSTCDRLALEREVTEYDTHDPRFGGCGGNVNKYGTSESVNFKILNSVEGRHVSAQRNEYDDKNDGLIGMLVMIGSTLLAVGLVIFLIYLKMHS